MSKPRVSLGLPVYNGEKYVAEAIQSILNQEFTDFELVITDNASTDRTANICKEFTADKRVKYFRNEKNLGAGGNFNKCLELSTGQFFKWCAHDDLISPNFLRLCVETLDEHPDFIVAYPRLLGIDHSGKLSSYEEIDLPEMEDASAGKRFRVLLSAHGRDSVIFGLWRRDGIARSSMHRPYYGSDCALLAELALMGRFRRVPDAILYNRDHPSRSVNLHFEERLVWQDPKRSGKSSSELTARFKHLVEIAYKHRDRAPFVQSMFSILRWASDPLLLGRFALEAVGAVSPGLRKKLRAVGLGLVRKLEKGNRPNHQSEAKS